MEKTLVHSFSTFGSKMTEFEWKKLETNEEIPKT